MTFQLRIPKFCSKGLGAEDPAKKTARNRNKPHGLTNVWNMMMTMMMTYTKVKIVRVLTHQVMVLQGSRGRTPRLLNFDTRWKFMVTFRHQHVILR